MLTERKKITIIDPSIVAYQRLVNIIFGLLNFLGVLLNITYEIPFSININFFALSIFYFALYFHQYLSHYMVIIVSLVIDYIYGFGLGTNLFSYIILKHMVANYHQHIKLHKLRTELLFFALFLLIDYVTKIMFHKLFFNFKVNYFTLLQNFILTCLAYPFIFSIIEKIVTRCLKK